jgi:hypothetical protein
LFIFLRSWRNQLVHLKSGAQMIFDGHNTNPDSIAVVKASRGTKLERFVLPCESLDF